MNINNIKNEDLIYFGERIEPYFASSIIIRGMVDEKNLTNILEWKAGVRWLYTNNYFFINKTDLAEAKSTIRTKFKEKGTAYTKNLVNKCFEYGNNLIEISKDIERQTNESGLERKKMYELLRKYLIAGSNYMIFQNIALFEDSVAELADETVKKYTQNDEDAQKLLSTITTANRLTGGENEQDDFLRLCMNSDRESLAENHALKYGWLSIRFFVGRPWTRQDVVERIEANKLVDARLELDKRIEHRKVVETSIGVATKDFTKDDKEVVQLIRDMVFLRTQRTDFFQESSYYVQNLILLIAKELGVSYDELLYLGANEVLLALEEKFDHLDCIAKRKVGFLVFFDYEKDIVLEAKEAIKFAEERPIINRESKDVMELVGKIGFNGKAIGKARIVKSDKDNFKVEKGDIMISVMTTPNFIPAMERAAAFVTDEGGITCHAAIIAREMKKPCIIGTKIATKVLKDGDLIEVDAEKGIVRKLNK